MTQNVGVLKCWRSRIILSLILHAHTEMSAHAKTQSKSYITCAYRNVGIQALTIRARRALHSALLLSQAEDLVLILVLSFWRCCSSTSWSSSGICSQTCPAYMGAMPAVLARLLVLARPVQNMPKCRRPRWNVGAYILTLFSENFRRSLGADCSAPSTLIKEL